LGGEFKVDLDHLKSFRDALKQSVEELEAARRALAHVRADQIGTARLDDACDRFQHRWQHGTEQLKELVKAVGGGVETTMLSYERFEEELSKSLRRMGDTAAANAAGTH
jgi:predicted  nucleic acid-binding Zn-ribbon protein